MYLSLIAIIIVLFNVSNEAFIGSSSRVVPSADEFSVSRDNTSMHYGCCHNDKTPFCEGYK